MSSDDQAPRKPPGGPGADVDYAVGYGRPPREHQFKKGDPSPNPKGRPRGAKRRAPDIFKVLMEPVTVTINGRERSMPFPEAAIQVLKQKALKGDVKATKMLMDLIKTMDLLQPGAQDGPVNL